jgi:hypothetical protein
MPVQHQIPPEKIIARVAAGASLTIASGHASASLDKFASWFLAAFGAGLALIVSHLQEVSAFIPLPTVTTAAYLFLVAATVCIAQRYVAMIIASGAAAAKEGREMGDKLQHMDTQEFFAQMLKGIPGPMKKMCKGQFDALGKGDYAVSGRFFMRLTMLHGVLASIELIILLVALANIVNKFKT